MVGHTLENIDWCLLELQGIITKKNVRTLICNSYNYIYVIFINYLRATQRYFSEGEKRRPEMRLLFVCYTQREYSSKALQHSIFKRILVDIARFLTPNNFSSVRIS